LSNSSHSTKSARFQYHLDDLLWVVGLTFFGKHLLIPVMHRSMGEPPCALTCPYPWRFVFFSGAVYQKDLGPDTAKIVAGMTEYNSNESWVIAE